MIDLKEYYKSRRWRIVRAIVLKRDNYTCQNCHRDLSNEIPHIHHKTYDNVFTPKEKYDCITLCIVCHGKEHNKDFLLEQYKKYIPDETIAKEFVEKYLIREGYK